MSQFSFSQKKCPMNSLERPWRSAWRKLRNSEVVNLVLICSRMHGIGHRLINFRQVIIENVDLLDKFPFVDPILGKPFFSCIFRRPATIKSSVFPCFCPYYPKRGQRLYYFQVLPFESEIHPLHNFVDLCRGHFVHTLNNEAEAKRRNDARRQQTRPRSHDYDRGR